MKAISIQLADETERQLRELAALWGLPPVRHNTAVIERAIERVYQAERADWLARLPADTLHQLQNLPPGQLARALAFGLQWLKVNDAETRTTDP